jgi:hypothetical protein
VNLPPLKSGIYRHYKGHLYQVFCYAHDSNADGTPEGIWECTDLAVARAAQVTYTRPLEERIVVVYMGLELDAANLGPRMAVRSWHDFHLSVCWNPDCERYGTVGDGTAVDAEHCSLCTSRLERRFRYLGPELTAEMVQV